MVSRVKTGIKGFDSLLEGGFPKSSTILLAGGPGTGKSIFCREFIYRGAMQFNEKGLIVTFEQSNRDLIEESELLGFDFKKLIKQEKVFMLNVPGEKIDKNTIKDILSICKKKKIKRLAIDSLTTLSTNAPIYSEISKISMKDVIGENTFFSPPILGENITRRFLYRFINTLKSNEELTTLLVSEAPEKEEYLSRDTVSEFLCDGVLLFTFQSMGGAYSRSMLIRKMRKTKNNEDLHPFEITKKGIAVHNI